MKEGALYQGNRKRINGGSIISTTRAGVFPRLFYRLSKQTKKPNPIWFGLGFDWLTALGRIRTFKLIKGKFFVFAVDIVDDLDMVVKHINAPDKRADELRLNLQDYFIVFCLVILSKRPRRIWETLDIFSKQYRDGKRASGKADGNRVRLYPTY